MINILDKIIYGLGALTLVGVTLIILALIIFFFVAIILGIKDGVKGNKKEPKSFGG